MDVLKEVKNEHNELKSLISKIEKSKDLKKKRDLFEEFYSYLKAHHDAEEKVIFPKVKDNANKTEKDTVLEMIEEHHLGGYQLSLLERTSIENDTWDAKFSVLKEVVTHHIDEEESDFLPIAKKVLSKDDLTNMYPDFEKVVNQKKKEYNKKLKK